MSMRLNFDQYFSFFKTNNLSNKYTSTVRVYYSKTEKYSTSIRTICDVSASSNSYQI